MFILSKVIQIIIFFNSTEVNLGLGQLYFFLLNILLYMYIF
jgi:hypothetical protein